MVPHELTLLEAAAALHTRQLGHLEYVQALLAQTDRLISLNAWISRDPEGLVLQAKALDKASSAPSEHLPLAGIPVAIKDNIDTSDLPTSGGTRSLLDARPQRNAPVVDVLLQAGHWRLLQPLEPFVHPGRQFWWIGRGRGRPHGARRLGH
jgi:mandelamide amidase